MPLNNSSSYGNPVQPPSEDSINQIVDAGFGRDQALKALRKCNNNVERAFDLLLRASDDPSLLNDDQVAVVHHHHHHHHEEPTMTTTTDVDNTPTVVYSSGGGAGHDHVANRYNYDSDDSTTATSGEISPVMYTSNNDFSHHDHHHHHQQQKHNNDQDSDDTMPNLEEDDTVITNTAHQHHQNDDFYFDTSFDQLSPTTSSSNRNNDDYFSTNNKNTSNRQFSSSNNTSFEDDALNRAIEASLQDQKRDSEPKCPIEKYRKQLHVPIGLKNIGNTCYVNSLFQALFMIPKLKQLIFSFSEEIFMNRVNAKIEKSSSSNNNSSGSTGSITDNKLFSTQHHQQQIVSSRDYLQKQADKDLTFIKESQKLLASMIMTNKTFIDPSPLVEALSKEGIDVNLGHQEDISEFYSKVLILLERMFSEEWEEKIENKTNNISLENPIKQIFYGICTEELEYLNSIESEKSEKVCISKYSEICNLILNVSEQLKDFYSSLDDYSITEVTDYAVTTSYKTKAVKTTWFKTPPPVLLVQLQRTSFDATKKVAHKINLPFEFQEVIYLDRYLETNKVKTTTKRETIKQIKQKISELETQLDGYLNYNENKGISIEYLFAGALEYVAHHQQELSTVATPPQSIESAVKIFENIKQQVAKKIEKLKHEINTLKESVATMFNDMHENPYDLCGILVHEGSLASSGHYYIYYFDTGQNCWWKFNDMKVTEVTEEEVMRNSKGIDKDINSSAYCLLYVDNSRVNLEEKDFQSKDKNLQDSIEQNIKDLKESLKKLKKSDSCHDHHHHGCCGHDHHHHDGEHEHHHHHNVETTKPPIVEMISSSSENSSGLEVDSLEQIIADYPKSYRDVLMEISIERWRSIIPKEVHDELNLQNKKFIEELNIYIEQQKEKREREKKQFQHQYNELCNKCFQLCQGQVNSTYTYSMSLQYDARIASFPVFLCAIDQIVPMKYTIADQVFYSLFQRKLLDLCASSEKSDQNKFNEYMSLVNLTVDDIPNTKLVSSLNELYSLFCFVATWYHYGLHYLYRKTFDRSISSFLMGIVYDKELTELHGDKKLSREKDILTYTAVCLQQIYSRGLKTISKDFKEGISWIKYSIEYLPLVWNSTLSTNDFVMDKILNYFPVYINSNNVRIQHYCSQPEIEEIINYWHFLQNHVIFKNFNLRKEIKALNQQESNSPEILEVLQQKKQLLKSTNQEIKHLKQRLLSQSRESYHIPFPDDSERLAKAISSEIHNVEMEYARDIQIQPNMFNNETDLLEEDDDEETTTTTNRTINTTTTTNDDPGTTKYQVETDVDKESPQLSSSASHNNMKSTTSQSSLTQQHSSRPSSPSSNIYYDQEFDLD